MENKHFEIVLYYFGTPFVYKCTTVNEAVDALRSAKHAGSCPDDMDEDIESLVNMKNGKILSFSTARYSVSVLDGEV